MRLKTLHLMLIWSGYLPLPLLFCGWLRLRGGGCIAFAFAFTHCLCFCWKTKETGDKYYCKLGPDSSTDHLSQSYQFTILHKETPHPLKCQGSQNLYVLLLIAQVVWIAVFTLRFLWILKFVILVECQSNSKNKRIGGAIGQNVSQSSYEFHIKPPAYSKHLVTK